MTDLISKNTLTKFREYFVGTTLREITDAFDGADVPLDGDYQPNHSGQRRCLVEQYYHAVDFTSWRDVQKVLRVFEGVLFSLEERSKQDSPFYNAESAKKDFSLLVRFLERDGFAYSNGRITPVDHNPTLDELAETAASFDSHALRQQIERARNALDGDPDLAIGTAKELLETTCRSILADFGISADSAWDVIRLTKETRSALKLVPEDIPDSAKGAETIKRVLANLGQVSQGLAELRNLYGTGHGKDKDFKGLRPRHARLAVGCATTLAAFLFETHEENGQKTI